MKLRVLLDGSPFSEVTAPFQLGAVAEMAEVPVDRLSIHSDDLEIWNANQAKAFIRSEIGEKAGDTETLLGITADGTALGMMYLAVDIASTAEVAVTADPESDFGKYAAAKLGMLGQLAGGDDPVALATAFLTELQTAAAEGRPLLPIQVKGGLAVAFNDIKQSGEAVAGVLVQAYQNAAGSTAEEQPTG